MEFHNTTHLAGAELADAVKKARTQEDFVREFFEKNRPRMFSASQVYRNYRITVDRKVPLTSIRRAMTNLMHYNVLVKFPIMVTGLYGKPEHLYCLRADVEPEF